MQKRIKDPRAQVEAYFRKLDAELIADLRDESAARRQAQEAASHQRHCSNCGAETVDVLSIYSKEFDEEHDLLWQGVQVCVACYEVAFPLANLERLVHARDSKLQLLDLQLHLERTSDLLRIRPRKTG